MKKKNSSNKKDTIETKNQTQSRIELIQGYYHFLCLAKTVEQIAITTPLSQQITKDILVKTGPQSGFSFSHKKAINLLNSIHTNPTKTNVFGYLAEISCRKGLFGGMRESLNSDKSFKEFAKKLFGDQYPTLVGIFGLLRNVYSHMDSHTMQFKSSDIRSRQRNLSKHKFDGLQFMRNYGKQFPHRKGNPDYSLSIAISAQQVVAGAEIYKAISRHDHFLLIELCYNSIELYKHLHRAPESKQPTHSRSHEQKESVQSTPLKEKKMLTTTTKTSLTTNTQKNQQKSQKHQSHNSVSSANKQHTRTHRKKVSQ